MCKRTAELAEAGLLLALANVPSDIALARALNVSQPAIALWRRRGFVPIERVPAVEAITGVPRYRIRPDRPDLFPPPAAAPRMETA